MNLQSPPSTYNNTKTSHVFMHTQDVYIALPLLHDIIIMLIATLYHLPVELTMYTQVALVYFARGNNSMLLFL